MRVLATALGFLLSAASVATASGEGAHEGGWGPWFTLFCSVVNFAIFVLLMRRFSRSPLREYLVSRRKRIVEEMAAASKARADAEKLKAEYEEKLAALEETKSELTREIESIAQADHDRLIEEARKAGERLQADAERRARSELESARRELRAEAARLAAELARAQLAERIEERHQRRLIREFLERVRAS